MLGQQVYPLAFCVEIKDPLLLNRLQRSTDHQLSSLISYRLSGAAPAEQVFMW